MKMQDPRLLGKDATKTATVAQLTLYEKKIVETFIDKAIMVQFLGSENLNAPGLSTYEHKQMIKGKRPSTTRDGDEDNLGNIAYTPVENKFVVTNQKYHLKYYDIQRSLQSGVNLDTRTAASIGQRMAEEMDYKITQGNTGPALTGILSGAQDAGAPSGVWDVAGKAYDDILETLGKLRDVGWSGSIDVAMTPGLIKILDRWASDGTTTFAVTYREWLLGGQGKQGLLNGGQIFPSSHPFTATGGPSSADKKTGATTATNVFLAHAKGQGAEVKLAHDLRSFPLPSQEGDIYRNSKIKYTVANFDPNMFAYMDAIDAVT